MGSGVTIHDRRRWSRRERGNGQSDADSHCKDRSGASVVQPRGALEVHACRYGLRKDRVELPVQRGVLGGVFHAIFFFGHWTTRNPLRETSPLMSFLSFSRPRESRDITVPMGMPSARLTSA